MSEALSLKLQRQVPHPACHEGKSNMDGKLKAVVSVDYFDGKNLLLDDKEVEPGGWPDKRSVR